jgi:hypothetical protein
MTRPTIDDPFDRRLRGFLDWQAENLAGAPSADEITARLADEGEDGFGNRFGSRLGRWPAARQTARLAWAFLILALLAAMAVSIAVIGSRDRRTSVVFPTASPTVSSTAAAATAVVPALCPLANELVPAGALPASTAVPQGPLKALVAYVAAQGSEVRITDGASIGSRLVARIQPTNKPDNSQVLGWSNDGSTILVHVGRFSPGGGPEDNCGDLWLVRSDGSAATKLTHNGPGQDANGAVLAGDGRSVAYVEAGLPTGSGFELRTVEALRLTTVLAPAPCGGDPDALLSVGPGRLAWSPDGASLALMCLDRVTVYSVAGGTSRDFTLPRQTLAVSMAWAADGTELMVAAVPYGPGPGNNQGALTIVGIDFQSEEARLISRSSVEVEWIIGGGVVDAFSPDVSSFIASGGTPGAVPGVNFSSTWYVIDVATGVARQVFERDEPCPCAEWLPDSSGFVYLDPANPNTLVQAGLDGKQVAALGPLEQWGAWHWLIP